jgi:nucleoside-diphosphate-sugar epimerase
MNISNDIKNAFKGKNVLVTGGVGFIGSNCAIRLTELGANVTIVDSMVPDCGGNLFNISPIKDRVSISFTDIGDGSSISQLVQGQDYIFNFAGHVSHIDSMHNPLKDLDSNAKAHITLLEVVRKSNPETKVIYLGTRQVYGKVQYLPVNENHPVCPTDINGINKLAGEWYHIMYYNVYGLRAVSLRLTNTYGPRQLIRHSKQGFVGWFVNRIITGNEITIFGDGMQERDFTYVDDVIEASLLCALNEESNGKIYNIGGTEHISLKEFVDLLIEVNKGGRSTLVPFPDEKKKIDIGSYYADYSKITQEIGWKPKTSLKEGLRKTLEYCKRNKEYYL